MRQLILNVSRSGLRHDRRHGAGAIDAGVHDSVDLEALCVRDGALRAGFDLVLAGVGVEPSGEAFNEISLESETGRPRNPLINAGAITTRSLAGPENLTPAERVDRVVQGLSAFAGRQLTVDETLCASEVENAYRNPPSRTCSAATASSPRTRGPPSMAGKVAPPEPTD
ncbi:glutaminase [Micromonospora profundi]|uniref:glutaminase n=1 Tax=Micromonospora profundi TaxID=1420889 RepID=UPI003664FB74